MQGLEEHRVHASVIRHHQLLGADRELVAINIGIWAICGLAFGSFIGIAISIMLCVLCLKGLQMMAKSDPLMREVYRRHIQYRGFYPAKSGIYAQRPKPTGRRWS